VTLDLRCVSLLELRAQHARRVAGRPEPVFGLRRLGVGCGILSGVIRLSSLGERGYTLRKIACGGTAQKISQPAVIVLLAGQVRQKKKRPLGGGIGGSLFGIGVRQP